ncbi:MAG: hypothetical protein C0467_31550 [Planctomycetaceae bacterium]|nr:hypothetical protein [Planctomycetaceae bacterium]
MDCGICRAVRGCSVNRQQYSVVQSLHDPNPGETDFATPDGSLLRRFVRLEDREALSTLVRRHSRMVWNVCLRQAGDRAIAEDAFQATFLALTRSARQVREPDALAGWLHGVAMRLALKARTRERRPLPLRTDAPEPSALDRVSGSELLAVLDEELDRLPAAERGAIVACCLEGESRDVAASRLGVSLRTLDRRLSEGREILRARLASRGFALSTVLFAVGVAEVAVPSRVAAAVGATLAGGAPSPFVSLLAAKVLIRTAGVGYRLTSVFVVVAVAASAIAIGFGPSDEPIRPAPTPRLAKDRPKEPTPQLGSARLRHPSPIVRVAAAPGGEWVVSAGVDRSIRVWHAAKGEVRWEFPVEGEPDSLAVAKSGRVYASFQEHIQCWDFDSAQPVATWKMTGFVRALAVSPNGAAALAAVGQDVYLLGAGSKPRVITRFAVDVASLAFGPDGTRFAALDTSGNLRIAPVAGGKAIFEFENATRNDGAVALGSDSVAVANSGLGPVSVWSLSDKKLRHYGDPDGDRDDGSFSNVALSADGKIVFLSNGSGDIRSWNRETGEPRTVIKPDGHFAFGLRLSADGMLAVGHSESSVRTWDPASGRETAISSESFAASPPGPIATARFSSDGRTVILGGEFGSRFWLPDSAEKSQHWSDCGRLVGTTADGAHVSLSSDRTAVVLYRADRTELRRLGVEKELISVAISPDGRRIAALDFNGGGHLWEQSGKRLSSYESERDDVYQSVVGPLAFSPESDRLAVPDRVAGIRILEVPSLKEVTRWACPVPVARIRFSPDGRTLAVAPLGNGSRQGELHLYEAKSGRERGRVSVPLEPNPNGCGPVFEYSPRGRYLAVGRGADVALVDPRTGEVRQVLPGHRAFVSAVGFHPSEASFVSAQADGTAVVRKIPPLTPTTSGAQNAFDKLWFDLCVPDPKLAAVAISVMLADPDRSIPQVMSRLQAEDASPKNFPLNKWIADLDSTDFRVRDQASSSLTRNLGYTAVTLEAALAEDLPPECRNRIERILGAYRPDGPAAVRADRVVEFLEACGTPASMKALETLAAGAKGSPTREAAIRALARTKNRVTAKP